ncbi:MAG TPA: SDR family oxidoreductase [Candidatus Omnitrophota bacterium]|nr:SDR family oxidoreductase [Candidatus Omnitrophota bacterium]
MTIGVPAPAPASVREAFDLSCRVAVITGGGGLLGRKHAEAVVEMGGIAVLVDLDFHRAEEAASAVAAQFGGRAEAMACDITRPEAVEDLRAAVMERFGRVDILVNNAANNPKVEGGGLAGGHWSRLENFPLDIWNLDIAVGLTGAFLCSRAFGAEMATAGRGVILNVASDLGLIAPDQRLYRKDGLADDEQPVKPVTYSVVKAGMIGLTRYLATYWADRGVRANAVAPGGVYAGQDPAFLARLAQLIPMGRMAHHDEYKATVAYLVSDASSYMTGAVLAVEGGRTCW